MPFIMDLLNEIQTVSPLVTKYTIPSKEVSKAEKLYNVAAIYRTQQRFQLDIPEELSVLMRNFNMPDNETGIIENMDMLIKKLKNNSINPELGEKLAKNFQTENDNEGREMVQVTHIDVQQVVHVAGQGMTGHHFIPQLHRIDEAGNRLAAMLGQLHAHEGLQAQADRPRLQPGDVATDDPVGFQPLHPAQAGRRRQVDPLGQLGIGGAAIALDFRQ